MDENIKNKDNEKLSNTQMYSLPKQTNTIRPSYNPIRTSKLKLSERFSQRRLSINVRVDDDYLRKIGITKPNSKTMDPSLIKKIESLRNRLNKERNKTCIAQKKGKESLAILSETMFKTLLKEENDHYEEISNLHELHDRLEKDKTNLENSKTELLLQSNKAINQLRDHIKHLSKRLQQYNI